MEGLRRSACSDAPGVLGSQLPAGQFEVVVCLQVHPELRAVAEEQAEAQGGIRRDAAPVVHNLRNAAGRDADGLGRLILRQAVPGQEFLLQGRVLAWVARCLSRPSEASLSITAKTLPPDWGFAWTI